MSRCTAIPIKVGNKHFHFNPRNDSMDYTVCTATYEKKKKLKQLIQRAQKCDFLLDSTQSHFQPEGMENMF